MSACPPDDELAAHLAGELDAEAVTAIAAHLDGCDACRTVVAAMIKEAGPPTPDTRDGEPRLGRGAQHRVSGAEQHRAPATVAATKAARKRGPGVSIGGMIDRYRVLRLLGQGGMGMVYAAHDTELDRQVAVKVMRPELGDAVADRLVRESRLMARVSHPSVITVFDSGKHGDQVFVAMEYVEGTTLGGWLGAAPRTWREIVALFRRAGEGLEAAHRAGLVHRDFKPENVLLAMDGEQVARVVVTDLGVARTLEGDEPTGTTPAPMTPLNVSLTATGVAVGTPAYMAPEQLDARKVDARADVFAFGVALWEAMWGERPFPGRSVPEIRAAIDRGPRPPPAEPGVRGASDRPPAWLLRPMRAALAAEPAQRPASMTELLARLDPDRHERRVKHGAMIGLGAAMVASGVSFWAWRASREAPSAGAAPAPSDPAAVVTAAVCDDDFSPPWDAEARRSLRALIESTGNPVATRIADRAIERFDGYASRWRTVRDELCLPDAPLRDLGTLCLEIRKDEIAEILPLLPALPRDLLVELDQTLLYMPGVEVCGTPGAAGVIAAEATPDTPAAHAVRDRLDEAILLGFVGDVVGERAALDALRADVVALDVPAITAEFFLELASLMEDPASDETIETLRLALAAADGARLDESVATVWIELVSSYVAAGDLQRAEEALQMAAGAQRRAGDDPVLHLMYDSASAELSLENGDLVAAERAARAALDAARTVAPELVFDLQHQLAEVLHESGRFREALEIDRAVATQREAELGADHVLLADARNQVAADLLMLGDTAGALAELQAAVEIAERAYGDEHLETARFRVNLGEGLRNAGRYDESLAIQRQAREILVAGLGADDVQVASVLENEAGALEGLGRWEEAAVQLEAALAILRARLGDDAADTATCRINLAEALRTNGKFDEALVHGRAGLEALRATVGDDHWFVAFARGELGKTLLAAGEHAEAIAVLEEAARIFTGTTMDPAMIADVDFALARALTAAAKGKASARAIELATKAQAAFEASGGEWTEDAAEARAWLAEHGPARPE